MTSYVCTSLDNGNCTEWVQTWSPLALSYAEGFQIASAVVAIWGIAWGFRLVFSFLMNR